jgi:hypothetical protein
MNYISERFDTPEERNARYQELKQKYHGVVKYSNPSETMWGKQEYITAYPSENLMIRTLEDLHGAATDQS